ncbi:hypothetical protein [Photobacterium kishitanii]|uniref:Uncharacterized protein n=1 Tax=Photobacterium kishitanii TaxID=318456 RepID=A0A2T3KMC7_9GAMM|nr:hypothetical protein [Photobacterium kishitanii]PSV00941.1 hypothetical protein C9J27_02645 [Photobacterium kishitanii]
MSLELYVKESLNMPSGKVIAQAAHALGMAFMSHCELVGEDSDKVTLKVHDRDGHFNCSLDSLLSRINVDFVDDDVFESMKSREDNVTVVIDNGLTCFNHQKTETVILLDKSEGVVDRSKRLQFDVDAGVFVKQGFFVNRAKPTTDSALIVHGAALSLSMITALIGVDSTLTLDKSSEMYKWLSSAFGKTVVGSKKQSKFDVVADAIVNASYDFRVGLGEALIVTAPISVEELSQLTYTKTFRLY